MSKQPEDVTHLFPSIPVETDDAVSFDAPIDEVTVLEDRAQVLRCGKQRLEAGRHRLVVWGVSPLLQDVSLRAEIAGGEESEATVLDVRAHRAYRVRREDKPEEREAIDAEIRALERQFGHLSDARKRTEERYLRVFDMLLKGIEEIPDDAAWGHVNHQVWHDTLESLFQRSRGLLERSVDDYFSQKELLEKREQLASKRQALTKLSHHFVACVTVDVQVPADSDVALALYYVVPNALWRPLHSARLADGKLHVTSCATVWQRTGEDWDNAQLSFSTARSSLGTEAPMLSDDLMQAQRKNDEIIVEQREVAIQSTGPDSGASSGAPRSQSIELPGVDDGGDLQHLKAIERSSLPSDGQPQMIPLFSFVTDAQPKRVCMPEMATRVFLKSTQSNASDAPLLAGPVELLQDSGFVGWTKLLYVASKEAFDLNFGPDSGVRVSRAVERETEVDPYDKWKHVTTEVRLFFSNLEGTEKSLEVIERIPVSEVDYVKVSLDDEASLPLPELDQNGFCTWSLQLAPRETRELRLVWKLSTAPEVQGL